MKTVQLSRRTRFLYITAQLKHQVLQLEINNQLNRKTY